MARVKGGNVSKNRRRKVLKEAKGYFGSKHRLYKTAQEQVFHSGAYAYRDRRQNKRNFRKLWITRINAACRENEISYSKFINGLAKAGIEINRKMLSEMAIDDPKSFTALVETAKKALNGEVKAWIGVWIHEVCSCGFPHSDISGSRDICSSPKLIAAYHVFHRLLVPRHPPCALIA